MQDLLNEDDFIQPPYNPWPLFRRFYVLAVGLIVILQLLLSLWLTNLDTLLLGVFYLLFPVIISVWMFTANTQNFLLERRVKIAAVFWLIVSFSGINFFINLVKIIVKNSGELLVDAIYTQVLGSALAFVLQFVICSGVIFLVSKVVKSKLQQSA